MLKLTSQPPQGRQILDQVSDAIRFKHSSGRTEQTYVERIKQFSLFHK